MIKLLVKSKLNNIETLILNKKDKYDRMKYKLRNESKNEKNKILRLRDMYKFKK